MSNREAPLLDKVALVTGASKGIGKAIAERAAEAGATVLLCAPKSASLEEAAAAIRGRGGTAYALPGDVTKPASINTIFTKIETQYGRLDILINNAGGAPAFGNFEDLTDEDWLVSFQLNVLSVVRMVRGGLGLLRAAKSARIITIGSISAIQPGAYNPHYTAMKAATINLSKYLANMLAAEGVLVNCVCPGPVHSESWEHNIARVAKQQRVSIKKARRVIEEAESAKNPLGRVGEPGDVASLVCFLASAEAAWITGSCFHVNGGKL